MANVSQWATLATASSPVVVCGHDGADCLPRLLGALARQTLAWDRFEVVYVDDASTDGSAAIVERSGLSRVVPAETRIGLRGRATSAFGAARGDVPD